jgi:hypothetical protein
VRYPKRKLVLFFGVQALAVAVMIVLANPDPGCDPGCPDVPVASVILPMLLILGELVLVAGALRSDPRVWHSLLALGIIFLVTAGVCLAARAVGLSEHASGLLAAWHAAVGALLAVVGFGAGFADLLARWRRPNDFGPEDEKSSGMWPFD